jgi:hypothetical protein
MALATFLVVCGGGFLLGLLVRPSGGLARLVSIFGLAAAFGAALLIGSSEPVTAGAVTAGAVTAGAVTIGDVKLVGGAYAGLFLACGTGTALLLCVVGLGTVWPDRLGPAALAAFGGLAVAMTATDAGVALTAGAAAATVGALVFFRPGDALIEITSAAEPDRHDGLLAEMRAIGLVVGALLVAAVAVLRPAWTSQNDGPIFVLGLFGLGIAIAVRGGAVPFHGPAARLRTRATPMASALLLVWIPAGLGVLAISWSALAFHVGGDAMNVVVVLLQTIAVATLLLGAVGALIHDELEEVAAYSIVQDGAFVLLALAARSDAAAEPARLWLVVFVAAKTGLVAWVAAAARAFGTTNLGQMRGWLRRTPILGIALVAIVVATLGWPGAAVYEARASLIRLALPGSLGFLGAAAMLLSITYYGRLLVIGVMTPRSVVREAHGERPRWGRRVRRPNAEAPVAAVVATDSTTQIPAEVAAEVAAAEVVPDVAPATKKRRSRAVAAEALLPAVTAPVEEAVETAPEVIQLELATAAEVAAAPETAAGPTLPDQPDAPHAPASARLGHRRRVVLVWRLNRTLEVSLVVAGGAAVALALAFGGLGARGASQFGIPLDTAAHATPTPSPVPIVAPTPSPVPEESVEPSQSPSDSSQPGASGSPNGSAISSASPALTPVRTAAPIRTIGS